MNSDPFLGDKQPQRIVLEKEKATTKKKKKTEIEQRSKENTFIKMFSVK